MTESIDGEEFERCVSEAAGALVALHLALHGDHDQAAVQAAVRSRSAMLALYRAWDRFPGREQRFGTMFGLRRCGHLVVDLPLHIAEQVLQLTSPVATAERTDALALVGALRRLFKVLDGEDTYDC